MKLDLDEIIIGCLCIFIILCSMYVALQQKGILP